MKEPKMPRELLVLLEAENDRQMSAIVSMLEKWPNFRKHMAAHNLGCAVAYADMMGVDADRCIRKLRRRETRPTPIAPGSKVSS